MFIYDTYEPGAVYGSDLFVVTPAVIAAWEAVYPDDARDGLMPPGLVTLMQQQAYKAVVTPRPPGHVQGGQVFELHGLAPTGSTVTTEVSCLTKEIRKERRWVRMGFRGVGDDGRLIYTGVNTVLVPM